MTELKPCPFCGTEASITHREPKTYFFGNENGFIKVPIENKFFSIGCSDPDCILYNGERGSVVFEEGAEDCAIEKWNRRKNGK